MGKGAGRMVRGRGWRFPVCGPLRREPSGHPNVLCWVDGPGAEMSRLLCGHHAYFPSWKQAAVGNREEEERNRGERKRADDA